MEDAKEESFKCPKIKTEKNEHDGEELGERQDIQMVISPSSMSGGFPKERKSIYATSKKSDVHVRSPSSIYRETVQRKPKLKLKPITELKAELEFYRKKFAKFEDAYAHSLAYYFLSHFFKERRLSSCFDFVNNVDIYKSLNNPTKKAADRALFCLRHIAIIESTTCELKDQDVQSEEKLDSPVTNSNQLPVRECMAALEQDPPPREAFDECYVRVKNVLVSFYRPFVRSKQFLRFVQIMDYAKTQSKMHSRDLKPLAPLGQGAFGRVTAVIKKDTQAVYAMKEIPKDVLRKNKTGWMCLNEMQLLSRTRSPFVLGLKYSFHSDRAVHLVFDMCMGGDLRQHLEKGAFDLKRSMFYAAEILLGIDHIHSLEYAYRDLKPSNILLTHDGHCKISDLGLVVKLPKLPRVLKHVAGTPGYWPPEICGRTGTFYVSDYWSWGVLLYAMLTGTRIPDPLDGKRPKRNKKVGDKLNFRGWSPFCGNPNEQIVAKKDKNMEHVDATIKFPSSFTEDTKDLLRKLFVVDPKKRLGWEGRIEPLQRHPFFKDLDWEAVSRLEMAPPFIPAPPDFSKKRC